MTDAPTTVWLETKHFPTGSDPEFVYVLVQSHSHDWVAEFTGIPVDEIAKRYEASVKKGMILLIRLRWADIKDCTNFGCNF